MKITNMWYNFYRQLTYLKSVKCNDFTGWLDIYIFYLPKTNGNDLHRHLHNEAHIENYTKAAKMLQFIKHKILHVTSKILNIK